MKGPEIPEQSKHDLFPETTLFENPPLVYTTQGRVSFASEAFGRPHKPNEDRILVDAEREIFAVADGIGGRQDGDKAALIVVQSIAEGVKAGLTVEQMQTNAHREIRRMSSCSGAAYVAAHIERDVLHHWHAGDCEIMVINAHGLSRYRTPQHTMDLHDTPVSESAGKVHFGTKQLIPGDRIILASDGLWNNLPTNSVAEIVGALSAIPVNDMVKELARVVEKSMTGQIQARRPSADNLSIIVFEYNSK